MLGHKMLMLANKHLARIIICNMTNTEPTLDWNEVAVVTLGAFETTAPDKLIENMGSIASDFVSPLPEGWEHEANGGVIWARNCGFADQVGRSWALTDTGREQLKEILNS